MHATEITREPLFRWSVLALLFVVALGIRLVQMNDLPLDFHPTRQYRSALISRALYYESQESVEDWQRRVAFESATKEGSLEPAILERLAAYCYRLSGAERLWIPRLLSICFWLVGGLFLYRIGTVIASREAGLVATAFYLFNTFGIAASRSFQPDPMMVMVCLACLHCLVLHHAGGKAAWLAAAAVTAGLAILIKPICAFPIFGAAVALALCRYGVRAWRAREFWLFSAMALFPGTIYYARGILTAGPLGAQARVSVVPHLVLDSAFWNGWAHQILSVIGLGPLVIALCGTLLVVGRWQRSFVLGLWAGYLGVGLVFTYHVHTHNYYHLLLIPIVALGVGQAAALLLNGLAERNPRWIARPAIIGLGLLVLAVHLGRNIDDRPGVPTAELRDELATEIGDAVGHSTDTLILAPHYGKPLKYHGRLGGDVWPDSASLRANALIGGESMAATERLRTLERNGPKDFFIVTDSWELKQQQDLMELLRGYPVLLANARFMIFDLREREAAGGS